MKKKYILMVLLITMIVGLSAQEISEKKDVAIFALNYYDTAIPSGALGVVDSQIQNVFINLGRFNIMGMTYRLGAHDINAFIEEIRKYNETNIEIPDEVKLGQVTFTEADFNRLTGAFITVVPIVTNYYAELRDDGTWEAVSDSLLDITVAYWGGMMTYQMRIVSLDAEALAIRYLYTEARVDTR